MKTSQYLPWFGVADSAIAPPFLARQYVVLRTFFVAGNPYFMGVDPTTLHSVIRPENGFSLHSLPRDSIDTVFHSTPYIRLLTQSSATEDSLTDAGLEKVSATDGIVLTIDLCPSHKALDRRLLTRLVEAMGNDEHPIHLSFSISGAWIREHRVDLHWLVSLEDSGKVAITWINHSNHHYFVPGLPLQQDFLLLPGTNVDAEVMDAEQTMLEAGLLPSVFFRFPGLVSDRRLVARVLALGLIPVGSDAWLAKNQQARTGSIVLIHGNGNEPLGVQRFLALLATQSPEIRKHRWSLLDLEGSTARNF